SLDARADSGAAHHDALLTERAANLGKTGLDRLLVGHIHALKHPTAFRRELLALDGIDIEYGHPDALLGQRTDGRSTKTRSAARDGRRAGRIQSPRLTSLLNDPGLSRRRRVDYHVGNSCFV